MILFFNHHKHNSHIHILLKLLPFPVVLSIEYDSQRLSFFPLKLDTCNLFLFRVSANPERFPCERTESEG